MTTPAPWWEVEAPPWRCVACGVDFDADAHLIGRPLCPDASCSRICEQCFIERQMRRELATLIDTHGTKE